MCKRGLMRTCSKREYEVWGEEWRGVKEDKASGITAMGPGLTRGDVTGPRMGWIKLGFAFAS